MIDKSYMLTSERIETARETIVDAWAYLSHRKAMDRKDIEILETLTAALEFVERSLKKPSKPKDGYYIPEPHPVVVSGNPQIRKEMDEAVKKYYER